MQRKTIKIAIFSLASFLAIVSISIIIMHYIFGMIIWPFKEESDLAENVELLTETYPTEIIILGENVNIPSEFNVRYISDVSEENLTSDDNYMFSILVINDLKGNLKLDSDDWNIIKKCVNNETNLYYLGNQYFDKLKTLCGNLDEVTGNDLSIGYVHEAKELVPVLGIWTMETNQIYEEKNPDLLSDLLIYAFISDVIKPNVR